MLVTDRTRYVFKTRRQKRDLLKAGYLYGGEIDWKINRGGDYRMRVTDIILGVDGNSYYYKKESLPPPPEMESKKDES